MEPTASRIVLVGFMAAGKSTVGALVAGRLGLPFVDLDREVERLSGQPIPVTFAQLGEPGFRDLEREATERADGMVPAVIAAGGGWMARPELRERWPDAIRIWLTVGPQTVLRRMQGSWGGRPMIDPDDPERSVCELMAMREAGYARAEYVVSTEGREPEEVADRVVAIVSRRLAMRGETEARAVAGGPGRPQVSGGTSKGGEGN